MCIRSESKVNGPDAGGLLGVVVGTHGLCFMITSVFSLMQKIRLSAKTKKGKIILGG